MTSYTDWGSLFFSAKGRAARTPFLIAAGVLVALVVVFQAVFGGALQVAFGVLFYPVVLWSAACVLAKRFHDRGRSGWWAALVVVSFIALWPWPERPLDLLFALAILWAAVELGVMPGEDGANRFGPPPAQGAAL